MGSESSTKMFPLLRPPKSVFALEGTRAARVPPGTSVAREPSAPPRLNLRVGWPMGLAAGDANSATIRVLDL